MGQELLDLPDNNYRRQRSRYFLATSSTGLRAVRGSASNLYTHACIATNRSSYGWVTNLWSSRYDLAVKNARRYNKYDEGVVTYEVVETKEISAKEARQIKKEIWQELEIWQNNDNTM